MNHLFVIDGAHRLSSLIAWVHGDYGIGVVSNNLFKSDEPARRRAAKATEDLINDEIGSYAGILAAAKLTDATEDQKSLAFRLLQCELPVQTLPGDARKAEKSFFTINQQGVPLTKTELTLLHSRRCPNSIAARAVNQRGSGHLQWEKFTAANKKEIVASAITLSDCLFTPVLEKTTIESPDNLPIAGRSDSVSTLPNLLDIVNLTNGIDSIVPEDWEHAERLVPPDIDGSATLSMLRRASDVLVRICGRGFNERAIGSLALHPAVYFYSINGRHQPTSFLAVVELLTQYQANDKIYSFTLVRAPFEDFLVKYPDFIAQVSRKNRGEIKGVHRVKAYLEFVVNHLLEGREFPSIVKVLKASREHSYLREIERDVKTKTRFTPGVKSYVNMTRELEIARRCGICNARVPNLGASFDHLVEVERGGIGDAKNAGVRHPYCNSARKELEPLFAQKKNSGN